jgi:hypothetical protein
VEARQVIDPLVARRINSLRKPHPAARRPERNAAGGDGPPVGLRPPCVPSPPALSHPDCRWVLTLIVAAHRVQLSDLDHLRHRVGILAALLQRIDLETFEPHVAAV